MVPTLAQNTAMVDLALLRLLQLTSPSLPTGAFSYSQGLEWAVESDWIKNGQDLTCWLEDILNTSLCSVDIPLLGHMYRACAELALDQLEHLCDIMLACRESSEMQQEEIHRGRALAVLLESLKLLPSPQCKEILARSQLAGFAMAAQRWQIPLHQASHGYLWSWLENQVLAGVKIIPLGQTEGQQILARLLDKVPVMISKAQHMPLEEIGATSPALALASSFHETQYTRIYRS